MSTPTHCQERLVGPLPAGLPARRGEFLGPSSVGATRARREGKEPYSLTPSGIFPAAAVYSQEKERGRAERKGTAAEEGRENFQREA